MYVCVSPDIFDPHSSTNTTCKHRSTDLPRIFFTTMPGTKNEKARYRGGEGTTPTCDHGFCPEEKTAGTKKNSYQVGKSEESDEKKNKNYY